MNDLEKFTAVLDEIGMSYVRSPDAGKPFDCVCVRAYAGGGAWFIFNPETGRFAHVEVSELELDDK